MVAGDITGSKELVYTVGCNIAKALVDSEEFGRIVPKLWPQIIHGAARAFLGTHASNTLAWEKPLFRVAQHDAIYNLLWYSREQFLSLLVSRSNAIDKAFQRSRKQRGKQDKFYPSPYFSFA